MRRVDEGSLKDIERELLSFLEGKGALTSTTGGVVSQYVSLFEVANKLLEQIEAEGVTLDGPTGLKKNPAVAELPRVMKQASDLLLRLGYTPDSIAKGDVGDEEL